MPPLLPLSDSTTPLGARITPLRIGTAPPTVEPDLNCESLLMPVTFTAAELSTPVSTYDSNVLPNTPLNDCVK